MTNQVNRPILALHLNVEITQIFGGIRETVINSLQYCIEFRYTFAGIPTFDAHFILTVMNTLLPLTVMLT